MSSYIPFNDARNLLLAANVIAQDHIHFANEPFSQPSDTWISFDTYSPMIQMLDIGAGYYREEGVVRILVHAPTNIGTDGARMLAKNIINIYRNLPARNPFYLNASISEAGASDDGQWFMMSIAVDFRYDDVDE